MEKTHSHEFIKIGNVPSGALVEFALKQGGPICLIAENDRDLAQMSALIAFFAPKRTALVFSAWDCRPYDRLSPHPTIAAERAATLAALANGQGDIVLTTQNAIMQKLPPISVMASASLSIKTGQIFDLNALHNFAQMAGYALVPTVRGAAEYAVRGGIIDLFPAGQELPIRIDLFGDVIDNIRFFDPENQRSGDRVAGMDLAPSGELILSEERISAFRDGYRALVGVPARDDPFYEAVTNGIRPQGVEHYLPLFYPELTCFFDYLPKDTKLFARAGIDEKITQRFDELDAHFESFASDKSRHVLTPDALYYESNDLFKGLDGRKFYLGNYGPIPTGFNAIDAGYYVSRDFSVERNSENTNVFEVFADHLRSSQSKVVITCASSGAVARMKSLLAEYDFEAIPDIESFDELGNHKIALTMLPVEAGFAQKDFELLSEADVLGARLGRKRKSRKSAENVLAEAASLSLGDFVVHREHGIGRFTGMQNVAAAGAPHECLVLEYQGGDRLFVPVENIDVLSPFGEEAAHPDKLGASAWQERKARTKRDLLAIAGGLIKLAAERNLRKAPIMQIDDREYEGFAAKFPFEETDDQLMAIEETIADLASGKPMDRLICGDVGFGKTEVALRAAFVAAMSGFQVAVIAPTTLLARQHARNFKERFAGSGLHVSHLSRFVGTAESKLRKDALEKGQIDIMIGTHALLSKDISFKDLGLLIIDEEQHFGVKHKEKIKELRSDVHVLTLSATPIPRTLQLALSGVRELSLIATAPVDRLAVRTYVAPFDKQMIRDALMREQQRGGQSFYVVPRVSDLPEIEDFLAETCPEMRVIVAHGQLAAGELDQRVNDFYDGKADILLATTIVESGLDIPTANTLIVHRADMFGLAQLYQIRGRVGRAKLRAFAYLTTKASAVLNPVAEKRLRVLAALDELGSGFSLASHDLDMRGAGNLLGEEQSGQIREVGFALYQSMLKDAIAKLKSGDMSLHDDSGEFSPEISLGVAVMIPEDYVTDLDTRLSLYRRLARLRKKTEIEDFAAELIDRFGPLPKELDTLFQIVRIKAFARVAGVSQLDAGPRGATLRFHRNNFANPKGLVDFIASERGQAKVKDTRIIVLRDWSSDRMRISGALRLMADLAKIAKA